MSETIAAVAIAKAALERGSLPLWQRAQILDTAAARLTETRTALRAQEQQFETAIEHRQTHDQNAARAESRLRDPDKARQAIGQTRHHLLQRSGIAALLQFNLRGETAARLLAS